MLKYFLLLFASAIFVGAAPVDDIESLLHYVGALQGAAFIRNGESHTPTEAEAHLRLKWTKQKDQIGSAEDFIRLCGTKSSVSGKPYIIRFSDGHEEAASDVLSRQLLIFRGASKTDPRAR